MQRGWPWKPTSFKTMNKTFKIVTTIFYNKNNEILLVKRANETFKGTWGLVGGKVKEGEDEVSANARELTEELGLNNVKADYLGEIELFEPGHAFVHIFKTEYKGEQLIPDQSEIELYGFFDREEIKNLVLAPNHSQVIDLFFENAKA